MLTFLIAPPYSPFTPKEAAVPPLGLARIAAIALTRGDAIVCDMGASEANGQDGWRVLISALPATSPDIVGIGPVVTSNRKKSLRIAKLMRSKFPEARIVIGGPDPTFTYRDTLNDNQEIDAVFLGEAEASFAAFLDCAQSPAEWGRIPGIAIRNGAELKVSQPNLLSRSDFDALPIPAWHLFPLRVYGEIAESISSRPYLPIETSRGCPLDCIFCACSNLFAKKFRNRSSASVIAEMHAIRERYRIDRFSLNDDNPSINSAHLVRLANALATNKTTPFELTFSATVDCKLFSSTRDMDLLRAAGFLEVFMGCETPHPEVIAVTMKTREPDKWANQIENAVRASRQAGVASRTNWILGLPLETRSSFQRTIEFIKKIQPDTALLSLLQPYPGTLAERYLNDPQNPYGLRRLTGNPSQLVASKFDPVVETQTLLRSDIIDLSFQFISELAPYVEANVSGSPYYLFELWKERKKNDSATRAS